MAQAGLCMQVARFQAVQADVKIAMFTISSIESSSTYPSAANPRLRLGREGGRVRGFHRNFKEQRAGEIDHNVFGQPCSSTIIHHQHTSVT